MSNVIAFLADGMEEIECLAVVDVLRRAGIEVTMASIMGRKFVTGSHGITVETDTLAEETDLADADCLFLPGGLPGTKYLGQSEIVRKALLEQAAAGKRVCAICAAPSVLGELGLLKGRRATCFPGFEGTLEGAEYDSHAAVVTDGPVTTARGMGCAVDLGLELVRIFVGEQASKELRTGIQYPGAF